MNRWTQIRQIIKEPAYRTKLAFFLILSFTVVLLAVLLKSRSPFWSEVLLEFAVTFGAVGILQFLWDFLGGDPMELRIEELRNEVRRIEQSITSPILSDLTDGDIGIERIWPDRRTWYSDPVDGLKAWQSRICRAKSVDMMSNTLWNSWMHQERFRQPLFRNIALGASVRILVYDPKSDVLRLRASDEKDVPGEMQHEIKATLLRFAEGWNELDSTARKNLEVGLTTQVIHMAQIFRADNLMLVAIYLSGKSGGPSPTMQLKGPESTYFLKYAEQFEIIWRRAKLLGDEQFRQILEEHGSLPSPPTED